MMSVGIKVIMWIVIIIDAMVTMMVMATTVCFLMACQAPRTWS